ncbi:flagellar biosynthesis anti-sigma factor FlgM [Thermosyntropha sp.]|uniref:flagellar biosynthesis anti-sigma factor FlgM n=1 Tax=Thermosyntropha sp. TaxID=2740820 RepID=UPI0025D8164A|nr:flagellar biosynthesis anti-sigma factor FlgM [Thermosyntropha sp.]MBO8159045.1 flagellar biosynthesis anti-sigma factor FlgM [Thermosyntropha sp.]
MIISKNQVQNILRIYGSHLETNKVNKKESTNKAEKDSIVISDESRIKQQLLKVVKQAPDMRMDKVEELKEKVSSGTYMISDGEVAEKMIERAIVDKLV